MVKNNKFIRDIVDELSMHGQLKRLNKLQSDLMKAHRFESAFLFNRIAQYKSKRRRKNILSFSIIHRKKAVKFGFKLPR